MLRGDLTRRMTPLGFILSNHQARCLRVGDRGIPDLPPGISKQVRDRLGITGCGPPQSAADTLSQCFRCHLLRNGF